MNINVIITFHTVFNVETMGIGNVPDVADRWEEESAIGNDEVVRDGVVVFNAPLLDGDPRLARL